MKISRHNFIHATANAMEQDSASKLFNASPEYFDLFALFSYAIYQKIKGTNQTEDSYAEHVTNLITELVKDKETTETLLLKSLSLLIFSMQIWNQLEKMENCKST